MAGAYSTDLREQMPTAVEAGATPEAAARRFVVARPPSGRQRPKAAGAAEPDRAEALLGLRGAGAGLVRPAPRRGWRGGPSPAGARRARPGRRRGGAAASLARCRGAASAGSAAATGSLPGCRRAPRGSRRRRHRARTRPGRGGPSCGRSPLVRAGVDAALAGVDEGALRDAPPRSPAGPSAAARRRACARPPPPAPRRARDGRPVLGGRAAAGSAPEPPAPAGTPPSATAAGSPPCPAATWASSVSTPPSGRAGGSPAAGPRRSRSATARTSAPPRSRPRAICRSGRFRPVRQGHGTRTRGGRRWPARAVPVRSSRRAAHAARRRARGGPPRRCRARGGGRPRAGAAGAPGRGAWRRRPGTRGSRDSPGTRAAAGLPWGCPPPTGFRRVRHALTPSTPDPEKRDPARSAHRLGMEMGPR
jgi:hypothetical protein